VAAVKVAVLVLHALAFALQMTGAVGVIQAIANKLIVAELVPASAPVDTAEEVHEPSSLPDHGRSGLLYRAPMRMADAV
jgi:hypothetical protein